MPAQQTEIRRPPDAAAALDRGGDRVSVGDISGDELCADLRRQLLAEVGVAMKVVTWLGHGGARAEAAPVEAPPTGRSASVDLHDGHLFHTPVIQPG
jgi:hypothetical protein